MQKLLIADSSEAFLCALEAAFGREYEIRTCQDGKTLLQLLNTFRPDGLILNLSLPFKDGLTVLQEAAYVPKAVLAVATMLNDYVEAAAYRLGVGVILISPCINAVRVRLADLMCQASPSQADPGRETAMHLHILNFPSKRDGFQQICAGVPMFARDPSQRLTKELYPAVAKVCGSKDARAVEHAIRDLINSAWRARDTAVWEKYFPKGDCPSNKAFLSRLAELLDALNIKIPAGA